MSQQQLILDLLKDGQWICSSQFYASFIADPRTRICELKKKGYLLENRKCEQHDYHRGFSKEWKLLDIPVLSLQMPQIDDLSLKTIKGRAWTSNPLISPILQNSLF